MTGLRRYAVLFFFLMCTGFAPQRAAAQSATYTDLQDFSCTPIDSVAQTSTGTCNPVQPGILAQGIDGNMYGMACDYFAPCNSASIFKMSPAGVITILLKFDGIVNPGITGANPGVSGLTLGPDGNFYGVTPYGGANGCGTVFQVTPQGALTNPPLHSFTGADGCNPVAPPTVGDDGYLYGAAANFGYKINAARDFHVLTSSLPYVNSSPVGGTSSPLLLASDGNYYGVVSQAYDNGGLNGTGTVYRMGRDGTVAVLYNFFDPSGLYLQGNLPFGGLVEGGDGNLYGTSTHGGLYGYGAVFQLTKSGSIGWAHSFPLVNITGGSYGTEGGFPYAGLIAASDGNFYGATSFDGCSYGCNGTLFKTDNTGNLTVLYVFEAYSNNCGTNGFNCGNEPVAQPMQATTGLIYGMARYGGYAVNNGPGSGVFYRLDAGLPAFVATIQPSGKPGDVIGILGQGFSNASSVTFNEVAAAFSVVSDTYLTAIVPPGATTGPVIVDTLKSNRNFRILASNGTPTLTTSTSVVSAPNPSVFGQLVSLTATLTTQDGSAATGTITFKDGGNPLGTASVSGNAATLGVSALAAGSRSITAMYSGDTIYLGSMSAPLIQVVNAPITSSDFSLSAAIPSFGSVAVGSSSSQSVLLSTNSALVLTSVQAGGDFSVTSNGCPLNVSLAGGTVCSITLQFTPTASGQRWFALTVQDGNGNAYKFGLEGIGVGATLAFTPGIISTVAGNGSQGFSGDGGPATSAELLNIHGIGVDKAGNLYIPDTGNNRIRRVDAATGNISTVAGNGNAGFGGDGGPATSGVLNNPYGVAVDGAGNVYIADTPNQRIRKVDAATGNISTVAGNGSVGFSGDGGPATSAVLNSPYGVAVDSAGNLYIADTLNDSIRKVDAITGDISTVAGNGSSGLSGDGGPATDAALNYPYSLAVDGAGNLYIPDQNIGCIRKVDAATGNISTVVASNAGLNYPYGVVVDAGDNLYIADTWNSRIRKLEATTARMSTVAGNGSYGFGGDGGPATNAMLTNLNGVTIDGSGNLYIVDTNNSRVRKVSVATTSSLVYAATNVGQTSNAGTITVSNIGNAPLNLSQLSASANFLLQTVGNDCTTGAPLAPGGSCNLGVVFAPTVAGNPLTGTVTIMDNAPGSPHIVSLSGVALGVPAASLDPTVIAFGGQTVGVPSAPQSVTLTNTGTADLAINSIATSGANTADFAQTNNCPALLSPGETCTIVVTFTAAVASGETATLNITDNAGAGLQTVILSGTGVLAPPVLVSITISPSTPVVLAGSTLQLTAIGNYSDGSMADLTTAVSWSSAQPAVATVGNTSGTSGFATGLATGIDTVTASSGTFSTTTTLTVNFGLTGSLSTGRSLHTATQLNNGKVLIAGGVGSSGLIAAAELYDPSTGMFTATGSLSTPRVHHTATLLNSGKVLITGGCNATCNSLFATSEIYDPAAETFTPTGNLNIARDIHTATLLSNGKVLIAGGYGGAYGILASAELYDPPTGTFAPTGNLNIAREWHVAIALDTSKVLITGGYQGGLQNAAELYDPAAGTFALTGNMNAARDLHTATLLDNGQVLIAGGWGGGASDLTNAEVYDPVSGLFMFTGNLNTARQLHTATLLTNGKVLIAGGSDTSGNFFASAEVYEPATGTFSSTGNLNTARDPHTATLLTNGNVVIVGGANSGGALTSAELYVPDVLTPANLVSIAVSPANSTIDLGATQHFTATGTFADTSTAPLQSAIWSVSDSSLATVTDDATNRGTAVASAGGAATITACTGSICGSANLTIATPKMSFSPASLTFGNQTVGTSSATQSITVNNTGNGTLSIASISLAAANSADFTESTTCGSTLAAGGACGITVAFAPTVSGARSASVSIADNASGSPQTVSLNGTGVVALTTTAVVSSANPSVFNQPVTLTATITSNVGVPGGTIAFADGAKSLASVSVSGGSTSLTLTTLAVGGHSITASYNGDASHSSSISPVLAQTVNKARTTTVVASSKNPQQVSQPVTFTATVTSQFGSAATGSIVFKSGNTTLSTVVLSGNQASLTTSFSSGGTRSITAQYGGDANNAASTSAVLSQSVVAKFSTTTTVASSLNPSFIGQAVTFTATVTSTGGTPPDGELITFRRGGTALGTAALKGGIAMFPTTALPTGSSNITAIFAADTAFSGSTSTVLAQVVNKYNTSISFTSNANPSLYGQSVTLTATVTSAGPTIPTGNVVFRDGGSNLATVALDSNGIATLARTNLPVGTLSLAAGYNGDTESTTSSASLSEVVSPVPTTTSLASSRNPSAFGQSVKLTATVTTSTGVTATGTVTFTLGSTTLGAVTLSGGKGSLTTTTLPRGADAITATYGGSANIAGSSGTITQQVN
jgi:large repetitive protein